ncbi:hypothetical protein GA0115246_104974 [Streptomyces sp. SolWspMP-sol7th]|nr:hypothetical protein GA0115246_104974 [Streptomyces sp. SolWspMP-sol7th]
MTGPGTASARLAPERRSVVHRRPDRAYTAVETSASLAYPTIPAALSLARSRRARSRAESRSPPAPSNAAGSASSRSALLPSSVTSRTQSIWERSVPDLERRKTIREPSGATVRERGAPRVKR